MRIIIFVTAFAILNVSIGVSAEKSIQKQQEPQFEKAENSAAQNLDLGASEPMTTDEQIERSSNNVSPAHIPPITRPSLQSGLVDENKTGNQQQPGVPLSPSVSDQLKPYATIPPTIRPSTQAQSTEEKVGSQPQLDEILLPSTKDQQEFVATIPKKIKPEEQED